MEDSIIHEQPLVDPSIETDTETENNVKETDFMPSNTSLSDITEPNNNENKKEKPKKVTNRTKRSPKDQKRCKKIDDMPVNDQPKIKIQYVDIKTVRKSENGQQGQNDYFNFVKLAVKKTVQTGPEGFDVLVEKDGLHISHLVRNSFEVLANCIHKIELGEVVTKTKIITGPPGCGKSSTVYQTIHLCLDLNWIVFYIPKCEILLQNGKTLLELENTCEGILEFLLELNPAFKELTFPYDESTFENYIYNYIYIDAIKLI